MNMLNTINSCAGISSQTQTVDQAKPTFEPTFDNVASYARAMADMAARIELQCDRLENSLISALHAPAESAAGSTKAGPEPVLPHLVATHKALDSVERRLAGAMATLNRLADSAGIERL